MMVEKVEEDVEILRSFDGWCSKSQGRGRGKERLEKNGNDHS